MDGDTKYIVKTDDITTGYASTILAEHITIQVQAGDVLAVMGTNGSGKSTLLRTLCALHKSLYGDIYVNNINILNIPKQQLALQISIVFSGMKNIVPNITVFEILKLGRFPHTNLLNALTDYDKEIITQTGNLLHINHLFEKPMHTLSDGELQKVLIGRALVQDTPIIIMDEPTSHLDVFNKIEIFRLIKSLAKDRNKTIIVATHELDMAIQIASSCLLLSKNKPPVFATTEKLITENIFGDFFNSPDAQFNTKTRRFDTSF